MGNDVYIVDVISDRVTERANQGTDQVYSSVSYALAANVEKLTLTGSQAVNGTGNELANTITGNAGVNQLSDGGGAGADTLTGLGGNDTYIVRNAGTLIVEGAGQGTADRVSAGLSFVLAADDNIELLTTTSSAGTTAINLTGNALAQGINGNAGANRLNGMTGNDTMTGGSGADTFAFSSTLGTTNIDRISDYSVVSDQIELENALFGNLATGILDLSRFVANTSG